MAEEVKKVVFKYVKTMHEKSDSDSMESESTVDLSIDPQIADEMFEMMKENPKIVDAHNDISTHMVWPRYLPQCENKNLSKHEELMIDTLIRTLKWFNENAAEKPLKIIEKTIKLFNDVKGIKVAPEAKDVSNKICSLKAGEMMAMHVRQQNCGFIVYKPLSKEPGQANKVIVSTFPTGLPADEIYKHSSDVQMDFPQQSLKVKDSQLLKSLEFAEQLVYLNDNTMRCEREGEIYTKMEKSAPVTDYVSHWLVPMLANRASEVATLAEFPVVSKKIRDDIICRSETYPPFRRSSFWCFVKVLLQLHLTVELGDELGAKFIYKLIMLSLSSLWCCFYIASSTTTWKIDVAAQTLAKISRRIEKLVQFKENYELSNGIDVAYTIVVFEAKMVIAKVRLKIDYHMMEQERKYELAATLKPLGYLDFFADTRMKFPKLDDYLAKRKKCLAAQTKSIVERCKDWVRHNFDSDEPPNIDNLSEMTNANEIGLFLCDFENWILYKANWEKVVQQLDAKLLRNWSFEIIAKAEGYYLNDPVGFSRMVLVQLKILMHMDKLAVQRHKIYAMHRTGINENVVNSLLLPHCIDMEIANDLQKYFKNRNAKASRPGLLEEQTPSSSSFTYSCAEEDPNMREVLCAMLLAEKQKAKNIQEDCEKLQELIKLKGESACEQCSSGDNTSEPCKCHKCEFERFRVTFSSRWKNFEQLLPIDEVKQSAILSELVVGPEIACLRDVLSGVVKLLTGSYAPTPPEIKGKWVDFNSISSYNKSHSERVFLGRVLQHPIGSEASKENECVETEKYGCQYYAENGLVIPTNTDEQSIIDQCRFKVEDGSPYQGLDWTMAGDHTEAQVFARLSECPEDFSVTIFRNFGLVRAGDSKVHVQKLYAFIIIDGLPFDNHSVLALVMQTLWQKHENALKDFVSPQFASKMCDAIGGWLGELKWNEPIRTIIAAIILTRIFELIEYESIANHISGILQKIRGTAFAHIVKIQGKIKNATNPDELENLRRTLALVCVGGALTFNVHFQHRYFGKIINDNVRIACIWLRFLVTFHTNLVLDETNRLETEMQLFTRLIRRIGIGMESKIREMFLNEPGSLQRFIEEHWCRSTNGKFVFIKHKTHQMLTALVMLKNVNPTFCSEILLQKEPTAKMCVRIDFVTGEFTINNLSATKLPARVTDHPLYHRFFGSQRFDVWQEDLDSYCTIHEYHGSHYRFTLHSEFLIVIQRKLSEDVGEIVPVEMFNAQIPLFLTQNYTHWWNYDKGIEFRPKTFLHKKFSHPPCVDYKLHLNEVGHSLKNLKTGHRLLHLTNSHDQISKRLCRLESKDYMEIYLDATKPNQVTVDLFRMDLKFTVKPLESNCSQFEIVSDDYKNMKVALKQTCGTLFGLRHGLLLEQSDNGIPTILLMPHGKVIAKIDKRHVAIEVDLQSKLRSPPFQMYHMDSFCEQLKATNCSHSAWFYLAYLHALTSHGETELLTGLSGTERALQILQSAFSWSSVPYDEESLETLKLIGSLAPVRKIVENSKQLVRWPPCILPHSAQDSYALITNKLIADSLRLQEFDDNRNQFKSDVELAANLLDYQRCLPLYPNLRIIDSFVKHKPLIASHYVNAKNNSGLETVRLIAAMYHDNTFIRVKQTKLDQFLFNNRTDLFWHEIANTANILSDYRKSDFVSSWFSLFEIARTGTFTREKFALTLGLLAHEGFPVDLILALQSVAKNPGSFEKIQLPKVMSYYNVQVRTFDRDVMEEVLVNSYSQIEGGRVLTPAERSDFVAVIEASWRKNQWVNKISSSNRNLLRDSLKFEYAQAMKRIDEKLINWQNIGDLEKHVACVEKNVSRLVPVDANKVSLVDWPLRKVESKKMVKVEIDFEQKIHQCLDDLKSEIDLAGRVYRGEIEPKKSVKACWRSLKSNMIPEQEKHLVDGGLYPRLVPSLVLPRILNRNDERMRCLIGALAVTILREQKGRMNNTLDEDLEIFKVPSVYPKWLLLQIDQAMTIHCPIVKEAFASGLDMNIGMEGTRLFIISAMLMTMLINEENVCQITVPDSIFEGELTTLRQCLGGMLNQRIYTIPCTHTTLFNIKTAIDLYKECKAEKGVILTQPEYRFSLQMNIFEAVCKCRPRFTSAFLRMHKWLKDNIYEISDKPDVNSPLKAHFVYSVADSSADINKNRWEIAQIILKRVLHHVKRAYEMANGEKRIKFDFYPNQLSLFGSSRTRLRPDVFSSFEILDEDVYDELKNALIGDLLAGRLGDAFANILRKHEKLVKQLMFIEEVTDEKFDAILNKFTDEHRQNLVCLCGYLKLDLLKLVLKKRWRVNYAVDPDGMSQMAVPVWDEKKGSKHVVGFENPDIAICLTQLAYYHSGLTEEQLDEALPRNERLYKEWMLAMPSEVAKEFCKATNLIDNDKFKCHLRFNMSVIDIWLSNVLFPREVKVFDKHLMVAVADDKKNIIPEQNVPVLKLLEKLDEVQIPTMLNCGVTLPRLKEDTVAQEWLKLVPHNKYDTAIYMDANAFD